MRKLFINGMIIKMSEKIMNLKLLRKFCRKAASELLEIKENIYIDRKAETLGYSINV